MRAALDSVLADPVFVRSPVLARLLEYLVDAALSGKSKTLKSYSVAVDGLGKSPDFDSQADTYARVVVARLRKALDTFYATAGAQQDQKLLIDSGSYEVRLVPNARTNQPRRTLPRVRIAWLDRRQIAVGIVACLILAVVLILHWRAESLVATQRWRVSNFPFVNVSVNDESEGQVRTELARQMRQSIMMALDKYEGVRVSYNTSDSAQYTINVKFKKYDNLLQENILVIDNRLNRLIWSNSHNITLNSVAKNSIYNNKYISKSIFYIAHPTGIIHSMERRRNYSIYSPYGCWLRFTALLQNNHTVGDSDLAECGQDWHLAAPDHPLAAALYGWTLTDKSFSQFTEAGRRKTIHDAVDLLESARAMNPNSPLLQVATMRAYAFAGDSQAVRATANLALKLNPDNLDIQGVAGLMLALQNDPQGEGLLNKTIAEHFNPPPWYFIGTFVSAMMRDDPAGAGRTLEQIKTFRHSLPILPILSAAYEGRIGQGERARAAWEQAVAMQPILRIQPDAFLSRLPMAPEVRVRLEHWLVPALGRGKAKLANDVIISN